MRRSPASWGSPVGFERGSISREHVTIFSQVVAPRPESRGMTWVRVRSLILHKKKHKTPAELLAVKLSRSNNTLPVTTLPRLTEGGEILQEQDLHARRILHAMVRTQNPIRGAAVLTLPSSSRAHSVVRPGGEVLAKGCFDDTGCGLAQEREKARRTPSMMFQRPPIPGSKTKTPPPWHMRETSYFPKLLSSSSVAEFICNEGKCVDRLPPVNALFAQMAGSSVTILANRPMHPACKFSKNSMQSGS